MLLFCCSSAGKHEYLPNENAKYVTMAFDLYNKGFSMKSISEYIEEKGMKKGANRWGEILSNPFYCRRIYNKSYEDGKEYVKGNYQAIVSEYTFDVIQRKRSKYTKRRDRKNDGKFPLKKVLKCKCCGSTLTGYVVNSKPSKPTYYKCNNKKCGLQYSASTVHNLINEMISNLKFDLNDSDITEVMKEVFSEYMSTDIEIRENKLNELERIQKTKKESQINYLKEGFRIMSNDEFQNVLDEFDKEIEEIEKVISQLNSKSFEDFKTENLNLITNIPDVLSNCDLQGKQDIMSVIFDGEIVYNKEQNDFHRINFSPLFVAA